ncbi:hypothetical protein LENIMA164B_18905 [Lelliottia nimipressuralis]|uniref:transposase n=1 Tax=Lelliottia nimipressuralis TaxID=69220 RepID=UPI003B269B88
MKKRFSDEQIISILREAEAGVSARELCRKHAISDATFYTWRDAVRLEKTTLTPCPARLSLKWCTISRSYLVIGQTIPQ